MTAGAVVRPADNALVHPAIATGRAKKALAADVRVQVRDVVVDTSLALPGMFEIAFDDPSADVLERAGLTVGTLVTISAVAAGSSHTGELISGEITALEGVFEEVRTAVVRGYTADHRLQRRRSTRTFVNMTDADIATKVARDAGLTVGTVVATRAAHDHVAQANQTDYEFLRSRAVRLGYEFGVSGGKFFFRPAADASAGRAISIDYPDGLFSFRPRVSAANLAGSVEMRTWDPAAGRAAASVSPVASSAVSLDGLTAASVGRGFGPKPGPPARPAPAAGGQNLGPEPSRDAHVIGGWPVGTASARAAADEAAAGLAEELGSTFAEAEGEASGDPRLLAGAVIDVGGVGTTFTGRWTMTRAVHSFLRGDYRTQIEVSGRHDRSLLGLATGGAESAVRIPGVVGGIVTNLTDPRRLGRVKVSLPWLAPSFETDWAPVAHAGAGATTAALFLPQVGDEVLVAFEFGDPHRPYVLGGLVNAASKHALGGEPVKRSGNTASIAWRGVVTPTGNRLAFHDEPAAGGAGPPIASDLVLGTAGANMALVIDQSAGTVALRCSPKSPESKNPKGTLTIECGPGGTIDLKTGDGGMVNIDGGAKLNLTAKANINIESTGPVTIKGNPIKLN